MTGKIWSQIAGLLVPNEQRKIGYEKVTIIVGLSEYTGDLFKRRVIWRNLVWK